LTGLTLTELCIVIVVGVLILGVVIAAVTNAVRRAKSICCNCNLKQVAISFKTWELDHTNLFPMAVSTNFGGTQEYLATGETFRQFQAMSNELSTPFILTCPQDSRVRAKSFGPGFSNSNVSYFVGVVANREFPQMFLSGDRNLTGGKSLPGGLVEFTTNTIPGWGPGGHKTFGNVALADGSVQGFSAMGLRTAVLNTGVATNRLAMP
jgi:Tfp pilus assembly protein PilE